MRYVPLKDIYFFTVLFVLSIPSIPYSFSFSLINLLRFIFDAFMVIPYISKSVRHANNALLIQRWNQYLFWLASTTPLNQWDHLFEYLAIAESSHSRRFVLGISSFFGEPFSQVPPVVSVHDQAVFCAFRTALDDYINNTK